MEKTYFVYILTNKNKTVLYIGLTSDLRNRVYQHKTKEYKGFTARYNVDQLMCFEEYNQAWDATEREKRLKGGSRQAKIDLINSMNPEWVDLYDTLD
jgi:putative endonuclease